MANTLSASDRLHKTCGPVVLQSLRDVDDARQRGRTKLREQKPHESVTAPAKNITARFDEIVSHCRNGASDGT